MSPGSRHVLLGCVLLCILSAPAEALEPRTWLGEYSLSSWTEDDGLPFGRVWSITQDTVGYLWLGTDMGLVRFDGVRFVRWTDQRGVPLRDAGVTRVLSARDGSLWVGFGDGGGIARIRDDKAQYYDEQNGIRHGTMTFLLEDGTAAMWAGNRSGVYRYEKGGWAFVGPDMGLPSRAAYAAHEDRHGDLWIAMEDGLYRRRRGGGAFELVSSRDDRVQSFAEDVDGTVWVTDSRAGFAALEHPGGAVSSAFGSGYQLLQEAGGLWVATLNRGLWRVERRPDGRGRSTLVVHELTVSDGLSSDEVRSIYRDRAGNLWVGTVAGLHRLTKHQVTPIRTIQGTRVIEATADGSVWVGTTSGVVRLSGSEPAVTPTNHGSGVNGLLVDRTGGLWIAGAGKLSRRVGGTFVDMPLGGVHIERVASLGLDSKGTLWLCDYDQGIFTWRDGQIMPATFPDRAGDPKPVFVYVDRADRVWIALKGGDLLRRNPSGRTDVFRLGNRFGQIFMAVYEDRHGAVWVGGSFGLARIRDTAVETITQEHGLPGYGVSAIIEDDGDGLWVGVGSGILRVSMSDVDAAIADPSSRLRYELYDTSDGLAGLPRRYGYPSAARSADGRLWFVTGGGVTMVDPRTVRHEAQPITAVLESATAENVRVDVSRDGTLPPKVSRLVLDYTALNVTSPQKVRFRYQLEGVDEGWVEAGSRRTAAYTNLRAGSYRFHVIASTSSGEKEADAAWAFTVAPSFGETGWPYVLGAIGLGIAASASWRWRVRQIRRQFANVMAERVRISRELHDTLLQGMVGVTLQLNAVEHSLGTATPGAREHLGRIRRQVEDYVRDARRSIFDLRSNTAEHEDLAAAIRRVGERTVSGTRVRVDLTVSGTPRPCAHRIQQQLLRIAQEAIANAVRHANADRIQLVLEYAYDSVVLRVCDNGRGFEPGAQGAGDHYGLLSMRERAEQVGGKFSISATPGAGTVVQAMMPVRADG